MLQDFVKNLTKYSLTKSQIKIADYIIKNQKRIVGLTAREVGKEIGVSDTTIIRLARTVGYDGYTDLQEQLRKETEQNKEGIGKQKCSKIC